MGRFPYKNNGSRNVPILHLPTMNKQTQAAIWLAGQAQQPCVL